MKRIYFLAGLGILAALAIVSPALGGPSLRSLVQDEVAKQLEAAQSAKKKKAKRGPAGPAGANGANGATGANGADGTARAYAFVDHASCSGTPRVCSVARSKGVTSVTETGPTSGIFCVTAPGLSPVTTPAVATVDYAQSNAGNLLVTWNSLNSDCPVPQYQFDTFDQTGAHSSVVSFSFVIP